MAWLRLGNKPLSEPMMIRLPTHIYITQPQWVKDEDNLLCLRPVKICSVLDSATHKTLRVQITEQNMMSITTNELSKYGLDEDHSKWSSSQNWVLFIQVISPGLISCSGHHISCQISLTSHTHLLTEATLLRSDAYPPYWMKATVAFISLPGIWNPIKTRQIWGIW